ncbi:MAG TPA: histidine kinase dimerization/phospho-acceptor domain-containing protein, partial [Oligoflexia bacterium]|nr:histidine kinase dimerization/phospho-acceptor domain-containing protein [Oligoflexia bacterium]
MEDRYARNTACGCCRFPWLNLAVLASIVFLLMLSPQALRLLALMPGPLWTASLCAGVFSLILLFILYLLERQRVTVFLGALLASNLAGRLVFSDEAIFITPISCSLLQAQFAVILAVAALVIDPPEPFANNRFVFRGIVLFLIGCAGAFVLSRFSSRFFVAAMPWIAGMLGMVMLFSAGFIFQRRLPCAQLWRDFGFMLLPGAAGVLCLFFGCPESLYLLLFFDALAVLSLAFALSWAVMVLARSALSEKNLAALTNARLALAMESSSFPMFYLDPFRRLSCVNRRCAEWLQEDAAELHGRHCRDVFGEQMFSEMQQGLDACFNGQASEVRLDTEHVSGFGSGANLLFTPSVRAESGVQEVLCSIIPDQPQEAGSGREQVVDELTIQRYLSEVEYARQRVESQAEILRRQSEELAQARDQALSATQAKSAFLANMSHELRTPLNGIVSMANLLCESTLSPSDAECAEIIKVSSDALLAIINDILDFSKIEAGKLTIAPHDFQMRDAVNKLVALLQPQINAKDLVFAHVVEPEVPDLLIGDVGRIRQVIINLLGNAIKFTPQHGALALRIWAENVTETHAE